MILPVGVHTLMQFLPFECGQDLWIAPGQQNVVKMMGCDSCDYILFYKSLSFWKTCSRDSLLNSLWRNNWPCWEAHVRAAEGWLLEAQGPKSHNHKERNSAKNLSELEREFCPSLASRWEHSQANTLLAVLWDPKQRTQLSCAQTSDPQNPCDNIHVLF